MIPSATGGGTVSPLQPTRSAYTALVHEGSATDEAPPPAAPPPSLPETPTATDDSGRLASTIDFSDGAGAQGSSERTSEPGAALNEAGETMVATLAETSAESAEDREAEGDGEQGGPRRGLRRTAAPGEEEDEGAVARAQPTPLPRTGRPHLPQPELRIEMRMPPYAAVADLPQPIAQRDTEGAQAPGPDPQRARAAYADAVRFGKSYYDELVVAAHDITDAAAREARQAHQRLDTDLALALQMLVGTLSSRLASNDHAREMSFARLEGLASSLRRRIRRAARTAYGRLSAMKTKYDGETSDPRSKRATLPGLVETTLDDNLVASWDAEDSLDDFVASAGDFLSDGDFTGDGNGQWTAKAMREAMIEFVGPYATADKAAIGVRHDAISDNLTPLADCLPCQLDTAFQSLDARMDYLMVAGPRSVWMAQEGAIKRVDDLVGQMRITIEEAHASTARQLVEQHDSTREFLIKMAKMEQAGVTTQTEAGTQQMVGLLTAIAGSQTRGLDATHAELSKAAEQPAGMYATSVISGSARLKSNIEGMTKAYPGPQLDKAREAALIRDGQRRTAERERGRSVLDFDRALAESIRHTYDQLDSSTEREFQRMASVPAQVRSTCDQALAQAEEARVTDVGNLTRAVNDLEARVNAAIAGRPPPRPASATDAGTPTPSPAPPAASTPAPGSNSAPGAGGGAPAAGAGQTMPPPASCAGCEREGGNDTQTPNQGNRAGQQGSGNDAGAGGSGTGVETNAPEATGGSGNNYLSSTDFQTYADRVAEDPTKAEGILAFKARIDKTVPEELLKRAEKCRTALSYWRQPDTAKLMEALRGLTRTSGRAVEEQYAPGNLRNDILRKYRDANRRTLSATSTLQYNYDAAIDWLDGNPAGGALNELRASINYSNEDSRIREVMMNLTPAQLAQIPASELDAIAADLDGENLDRFNALRRGDGGLERAIALRDSVNSANMRHGSERGRKLQEAVATARGAGGMPIEGAADREMADIFHLEHPSEVAERGDALWRSTLENFAGLRQVQYTLHYQTADTDPTGMSPELSDEQRRARHREPFRHDRDFAEGRSTEELEDMMLRFAVADRYYGGRRSGPSTSRPNPPGYHGESSGVADRPGRLPPDMVNWISQTIHHGPDSVQERGARLLVEFNRAEERGSAERLDDTLHIGSADATEGGGYAPRDTAAAEVERARVFTEFARYRRELAGEEPLVGPEDPRSVQRDLRKRFSRALRGDPEAEAVALGIINSERGTPIAAIEYAIDRENKDMALRYLRRMDRREIDAMMAEYDRAHPDGPTLYERLGLFEHHGSAVSLDPAFTGDDALELEIAIMGVPQNEREQAEVALRRMDQQIEHSTGAGQAAASDEFARLQSNRDELRRVMGVQSSDIDELGRIRLTDAAGNPATIGNFTSDGSFRARPGATLAHFQRAVTLGQITAENFTRAVDAAANFLVTTLMVIAAVVITIATAGAASILLPMLLTAAIGLAGVGMTWALKGGRYSRDDLTRDLANVAVQTLVAGVGAAAGLYMRAGAAGGKAVTTMMGRLSMSEAQLATRLGMRELGKLTLKQELMLGALTGITSNVGGAMADPRAWREGRVGEEMWHGLWRGGVSGMIGGAAMRPMGRLAPTAGLGTQVAARSVLNGVGNSASRAWDLAYDANRGAYTGTLDDALGEIASAGAQGVIQGGLEAGGERFGQRSKVLQGLHERHSRPDADDVGPRIPGPAANDNEPAAQAAPRAEAETVEPPARLRSALGDDEGPARLRSGSDFDDEVTKPGIRIQHPEFPDGVNLSPGALDRLPPILPDTVVRGVDPTDGAQARQNYDIMRARTPDSEVLLAFNPTTGEYMAVQGLPHSVTPPPEGWITLRHSHPRVIGGDEYSHFASILPSGIGGDFSVLRTEVDRLAAANPHVEVRRASTIDIEVNGQHVQTVFEITKSGDNYSLSVTLHPPQYGVATIGPVTGDRDGALREYAYKARDLTANGSDFGLGHNKTSGPDLLTESGRPDAPSRVVRGASLDETERSDAAFVAGRMAQSEDFDRQARGASPRGEIDPVIARAATSSDAQERVRAMGLVGRPDSLERLTRLLNSSDQTFTPEMRAAVARATLEATRAELIRTGNLAPGDELLMLFRGVTGARTDDYESGGMDISRLGPGRDEDAGRGLYGSQDFQSALNYAGADGRGVVLPLIVRRSELGNVIDVRSGTPLGDRWLAYVRATARGGVVKQTHPHLSRILFPFADSPIGLYRDGRGDRFEDFLKSLADDPTLPPAIREAARDPHITLMDLGGVASWGNDRSMLTDQFAMHHQRILDMFNEAHGFPRPRTTTAPAEETPRLRSALPPKATPTVDPAEAAAMARTHPDIVEINRMQAALATADPDGPHALIARNQADDDAGFAAQEALDALSRAPQDAHLVDIPDADIASVFPPPNGKYQEKIVSIGGMKLRLFRAAPTTDNPNPPIRYEASIPPPRPGQRPRVYQFGSGELRVWRSAPTKDHPAGRIMQESIVGPRRDRQGYEDQISSHSEGGYAGAALERGHLHGAGLGVESPFGIGLVPREVNQILQNRGIEGWMRRLRDVLPPGATLIYSTDVAWHSGTLRHARISYAVDIVINGERHPYADFAINISADPAGAKREDRQGTRSVTVEPLEWSSPSSPAVNRYFDHLHEAVDLPQVLLYGLARSPPSRSQAVRALAAATPEEVSKAIAASEPWELNGIRPQDRSAFRIGAFREELTNLLARDPSPRIIVIDTRGSNLTASQLKKIDEALARLSPDDRARIIRLVDAP